MAQAREESVIKGINREIVQECEQRGYPVSDTLVTFMMKALLLGPGHADRPLTRQDAHALKELCLGKLMEKCSPSLDTIKMQLYFDANYTSRDAFLEELHGVLESKLSALSREITDIRLMSTCESDALYHKITTYILLRSAMGSPADVSSVEEATAALQSIFPKTGGRAFSVLMKKQKEELLKEFTMTVTGIRLFNRANREGGEFNIHFLMPAALNEVLPVTTESIRKELNVTQSLVWKYTAALEKLTDPDLLSGQCDVPIVLLKQALYNVRQHQVFLQILLTDACLCAEHVGSLQTEILSQLKLLGQKVKPRTPVPTAVVFPLFQVLAKLWFRVQDEAELLSILRNITVGLQPFLASQAQTFSEVDLDGLLEAAEVKTDEQRRAESYTDEQIDLSRWTMQEWVLPESTSSFSELPLQFNGFCAYTLVKRDGLLLPGNPTMDVLKHKEKFYAFSSREAAFEFASCPDDFITQMHQEDSLLVKSISKFEVGTQTVLQPMESNIDKSYQWNEWELRREALKLAEVRTKVTHSVQTELSHMRRENTTQTWVPKDTASQSKTDGGSNVPKPQIYLAGLRGRNARLVKMDLTRSLDEQ